MVTLVSSPKTLVRGDAAPISWHAVRSEFGMGTWHVSLQTQRCPGVTEAGGNRLRRKQGSAVHITALLCNNGAAHLHLRRGGQAAPCASGAPAPAKCLRTGQLRWHALKVGQRGAGAAACSACPALVVEEEVAARLDVAAFLYDSLPSQLWFGGYMHEARGTNYSSVARGRVTTSLTEPQSLTWIAWAPKHEASKREHAPNECTEDADLATAGSEGMSSVAERSERPPLVGAHRLQPGAGFVGIAAAALLVLGPAISIESNSPAGPGPSLAMLPLPAQGLPLPRTPPTFDVRTSLFTPSQQGNQFPLDSPPAQAGPPVYIASARSGTPAPPAPNPLGPRLPVLVYDPDELLREPPREEAGRAGAEVKSPADLAESLQKGCGGPQCFATLFRPSAELEGLGFAGALILGERQSEDCVTWLVSVCRLAVIHSAQGRLVLRGYFSLVCVRSAGFEGVNFRFQSLATAQKYQGKMFLCWGTACLFSGLCLERKYVRGCWRLLCPSHVQLPLPRSSWIAIMAAGPVVPRPRGVLPLNSALCCSVCAGVVAERRRSGLVQLKDLVKVAEDEKHESEALVASLQQVRPRKLPSQAQRPLPSAAAASYMAGSKTVGPCMPAGRAWARPGDAALMASPFLGAGAGAAAQPALRGPPAAGGAAQHPAYPADGASAAQGEEADRQPRVDGGHRQTGTGGPGGEERCGIRVVGPYFNRILDVRILHRGVISQIVGWPPCNIFNLLTVQSPRIA